MLKHRESVYFRNVIQSYTCSVDLGHSPGGGGGVGGTPI